MSTSTKNFTLIALLSITSSFLGIFFYHIVFNDREAELLEEARHAMYASENDLLFSNKLNKYFRSSSPTDFIDAAKNSVEAVVFIRSLSGNKSSGSYNMETGSGVIISGDGYIVTNNHVINGSSEVEVLINDNREFKAKVVGHDPNTDLALVKIEADNLHYLIFGNSDSLRVGEWVLAVGNPFRLQSTVTAGIVSAKGRSINIFENQGIESFIQTDAAVNPGNSGGALVNTKGELIGINTAMMTYSGKYEGFSFAVPANLAKKVVSDLRQYGSVQRGWLGVEIENVDNVRAKALGLQEVAGVFISLVIKGGAAQEAGLLSSDVITKINNRKVNTISQFTELVGTFKPGDRLEIEYLRNGQKKSTYAILRNQLNTVDLVAIRKDKALLDLGLELRELDSKEKSNFNSQGIMVVTVYRKSNADLVSIEPGYIIDKVNNRKVESVDEILSEINNGNEKILLSGFYENYPGEFRYELKLSPK